MNQRLTPDERLHLALYREAIDLMLQNGKWQVIDGSLYWVVPERIADAADKLVCDIEDSER